jgi:hypothetical protein
MAGNSIAPAHDRSAASATHSNVAAMVLRATLSDRAISRSLTPP